jgi:hypothetical protein
MSALPCGHLSGFLRFAMLSGYTPRIVRFPACKFAEINLTTLTAARCNVIPARRFTRK